MGIEFKNENTDFLIKCIMQLQTEEECYNFFQDLCTINEFHSMAQRCVVAKMLSDKKVYKYFPLSNSLLILPIPLVVERESNQTVYNLLSYLMHFFLMKY